MFPENQLNMYFQVTRSTGFPSLYSLYTVHAKYCMVSAIMQPVSHNPDRVQPYPFQAQLTACIDARGLQARNSNSAAVRGT